MPDISMCPSEDCPNRTFCRRNEASGTRPYEHWQAYSDFVWFRDKDGRPCCDSFWPVDNRRDAAAPTEAGGTGEGPRGPT